MRPSRGAIAVAGAWSRGHRPRHLRNVSPRGARLGWRPKGLPMKKVGSFLGDWWRLVTPYFKSEERWIAISLLIGAIALTFSPSGWKCCSTTGTGAFTTACRTRTKRPSGGRSSSSRGSRPVFIMAGVARAMVSPYLRLRWRRWLTSRYLAHWLDGRGYYRIELQRTVDNADQRIAEDLRLLGEYTMQLPAGPARRGRDPGLVPVHPVAALRAAVAGTHRHRHTIPGYMAWVPDLCRRRHLPRQPGRAAADPAQLPEAALRGQFPLLAGAGARECRGHRALSRRAARGRKC